MIYYDNYYLLKFYIKKKFIIEKNFQKKNIHEKIKIIMYSLTFKISPLFKLNKK